MDQNNTQTNNELNNLTTTQVNNQNLDRPMENSQTQVNAQVMGQPKSSEQLASESEPVNAQVMGRPQMDQTQPVIQPQYIAVQNSDVSEEYKPISMWGYFGYEILFAIPLVGFILLLVFSFGGSRNINLRNFARSYFCGFIILLIIGALVFVLMLLLGGAAGIGSGLSQASRY